MLKKTVTDLQKGDQCYIEDNFGQLYLGTVRVVTKFQLIIDRQRFSKKTGWETPFKDSQLGKGKQPHRNRIHNGDGMLYTQDEADKRTIRQRVALRKEELIYQITHFRTWELRKRTNEQLEQCVQILTTEAKNNE